MVYMTQEDKLKLLVQEWWCGSISTVVFIRRCIKENHFKTEAECRNYIRIIYEQAKKPRDNPNSVR